MTNSRFTTRAISASLGLIASCLLASCDCIFPGNSNSCTSDEVDAEAAASDATHVTDVLAVGEPAAPGEIAPLITPSATSSGTLAFTVAAPHVEFLVTSERRLQITFLDEADNLSTLPGQPIMVRIVDHSPLSKLAFAMNGRVLTSDLPLPEGNDHRLVVNFTGLSDAIDVLPPLNEWQPVGNDSAISTLR